MENILDLAIDAILNFDSYDIEYKALIIIIGIIILSVILFAVSIIIKLYFAILQFVLTIGIIAVICIIIIKSFIWLIYNV